MPLGEFSIIFFEFWVIFGENRKKEQIRKNWAKKKKKSGHFAAAKAASPRRGREPKRPPHGFSAA